MDIQELIRRLYALGYQRMPLSEEDFILLLREEPLGRKLFILGRKGDSFDEWRRFMGEAVLPYRREKAAFSVSVLLPPGEKVAVYLAELPWVGSIWAQTDRGIKPIRSHPEWSVEERLLSQERVGERIEEVEFYAPSWALYLLLAVNTLMLLLATYLGGSQNEEVLIRLGAKYAPLLWMGESWRLVTPLFLHAGIIHFLVNSYALYQLGRVVDRLFGWPRFLFIYFSAGIAGSALSVIFRPDAVSVGASGAIFGLLGALLYFSFRKPKAAGRFFGRSLWSVLILNLIIGFLIPGIDYFGHLGGVVGGALAAVTVGLGKRDHLDRRWIWRLSSLLIFGALLLVSLTPPSIDWYRPLEEGRRALRIGKVNQALISLEESRRLNPKNPMTNEYLIRAYHLKIERSYLEGDLEGTAICYRRLISLHEDWRYHFDLGCIYYQQKKYPDALKEFERVLEKKPDHKEALEFQNLIRRMGYE